MNIDGNEQGYQYSRLWLNSFLKSIDTWNVSKYEERLNIIYERFLKIWEFPDVEIAEVDESEEQNILMLKALHIKNLNTFIFENTKVEEDTIAQMYFYVIRNLYEKNSQLLVSNQDVLKITRNASDFRAAQEVVNGWLLNQT
jgi:hypothetical protein